MCCWSKWWGGDHVLINLEFVVGTRGLIPFEDDFNWFFFCCFLFMEDDEDVWWWESCCIQTASWMSEQVFSSELFLGIVVVMICCWMGRFFADRCLIKKIRTAEERMNITVRAMMMINQDCFNGSWKWPLRESFSTKKGWWPSWTRWGGGWYDWLVTTSDMKLGYLRSTPLKGDPEPYWLVGTRTGDCGGCGTWWLWAGGLFVGDGKLRIASLLATLPSLFVATQW